jgi:hypothetical protein
MTPLEATLAKPKQKQFDSIGDIAHYPTKGAFSKKATLWGQKERAVLEKFQQRIFYTLHIPDHFEREGVALPTAAAKEKTFKVCETLFKDYFLMPDAIRPTVEEGIFLSYDRVTDVINKSMKIEVYNTMEIALIVCDNIKKKTIYNEDIEGMDFSRAISIFKA